MIYSAEIALRNRDPKVLAADYAAVMTLIQERDAAQATGPSLPASPPTAPKRSRKRKQTAAKT